MAIKEGDIVVLDYEGKLEDGEVFDSSTHGDHSHPIEFEVGAGQMIPGFEKAVKKKKKGEKKEFSLEPEDAYGHPNDQLVKDIPKDSLPKDQEPKEGMFLVMNTPDGHQFPAKIKEVKEDKIIIDLNHPLAGKKLIFKIEIKDVKTK